MPVVIPDCTSCKHLFEEKQNDKFCCSAFPKGIPDEYFWGAIDVTTIPDCSDGIKFEK